MHWSEVLSTILLGMRACLKDDVGVSPAEWTLCMWRHILRHVTCRRQPLVSLKQLTRNCFYFRVAYWPIVLFIPPRLFYYTLEPKRCIRSIGLRTVSLPSCRETIRRPLEQLYQGPCKVLRRKEEFFCIEINGKEATFSIDRLKPAYFLVDPSTPHPSFPDHRSNPVSDSVVTRSGRRVRLKTPFQAS
ncbi:hypothetical protein AVEN_97617-1 [Araneus ventricosus]|uniref:Uncharacterized protein n=1 Tax=Araneus ventricosus TaxID=182803 RepID=A0A4Y2GHG0_ARAVE|nr:hypothetical protein AVEN_97617-1 [Araneus ventricosus]